MYDVMLLKIAVQYVHTQVVTPGHNMICLFRMSQKVFTMMSLLNDDAVTKYSWHSIEQ